MCYARVVILRGFRFCSNLIQELEEGKRKRKHEGPTAESIVSVKSIRCYSCL